MKILPPNKLQKNSYSSEILQGPYGILCVELAALANSHIDVLHNLLNPEFPAPSKAINDTIFTRQLQADEQNKKIIQSIDRFPSLKDKLHPPGPDYYYWEWPRNSRFQLAMDPLLFTPHEMYFDSRTFCEHVTPLLNTLLLENDNSGLAKEMSEFLKYWAEKDRDGIRWTTAKDESVFSDPQAASGDLVTAMLHVSTDRLVEFEPSLIELTSHKDALIRGQAFEVLIGIWGRTDIFETAYRLLRSANENFEVRKKVANGFKLWATDPVSQQSALRSDVINTIVHGVLEENDVDKQMQLYKSAICIITDNRCLFTPNPKDIQSDRNWDVFSSYT